MRHSAGNKLCAGTKALCAACAAFSAAGGPEEPRTSHRLMFQIAFLIEIRCFLILTNLKIVLTSSMTAFLYKQAS